MFQIPAYQHQVNVYELFQTSKPKQYFISPLNCQIGDQESYPFYTCRSTSMVDYVTLAVFAMFSFWRQKAQMHHVSLNIFNINRNVKRKLTSMFTLLPGLLPASSIGFIGQPCQTCSQLVQGDFNVQKEEIVRHLSSFCLVNYYNLLFGQKMVTITKILACFNFEALEKKISKLKQMIGRSFPHRVTHLCPNNETPFLQYLHYIRLTTKK